jgi:hypothetical protein
MNKRESKAIEKAIDRLIALVDLGIANQEISQCLEKLNAMVRS